MQALEQTSPKALPLATIDHSTQPAYKDQIIRTYDKDVAFVVRDSKYTQYKSYIHIKQYQIINDEQEPIMIATPKLEINFSLENHTASYWCMDIFPCLEKGKQFHRMIKRLELCNKKYISSKFGEDIEYKSCLTSKKKVHPRMSLSLPTKNNKITVKAYINHTESMEFTDIQKEDRVVLLIRMKDIYINTETKTAGCNWELMQVKVDRLSSQNGLLLDKNESTLLNQTQQIQQLQQMVCLFQQINPAIVMNNNNTINHTNVLNAQTNPFAASQFAASPFTANPSHVNALPATPYTRSRAPVKKKSSVSSGPMAMVLRLDDILSIKNSLKSVDRSQQKKRIAKPLRDFPTQQDLSDQRNSLKNISK